MAIPESVLFKALIIFITTYLSIIISQELSKLYPDVNPTILQALAPSIAFIIVWILFRKKAE